MGEPLVEVLRGPVVEAVHRGDVAVVGSDGQLLCGLGSPLQKVTFWRSAAKPFQALPVVSSGAAGERGLLAGDLALISGSHNGEQVHVDQAAALLGRIGGELDDLACGRCAPLDGSAASALHQAGARPSALHNNCSGKHLGMLAVADRIGAARSGYRSGSHPVQHEILAGISRFTGLAPKEIVVGVDGCGVPCFGTSVYHLALAFARLMRPERLGPTDRSAAGAIRGAMEAHPYLVAGRNRLDTALIEAAAGELLAKDGAAGIQCVGVRGGIGIAVKIEDGGGLPARPAAVATLSVLEQLGICEEPLAALRPYAHPTLHNIDGDPVGAARPVFTLPSRSEVTAWRRNRP